MDIKFLTDKKYQLEYKLKVLQEQKINISNFDIEHEKVLQELKVIEDEIRVYEFNDLYNKIDNQLTEAYELINSYNFEVANNNLEFIRDNIDKLRSLASEKEDGKILSIFRQFKEVIKFKRDMAVTTRLKKINILEEELNSLIIEIDNLMNTKSRTSMIPSINFKVEKYMVCYNEVQKLLTDHEAYIKNDIDMQHNKLDQKLENYNKMIDKNKKKTDRTVSIFFLFILALIIFGLLK